jgi:hypothetical protein
VSIYIPESQLARCAGLSVLPKSTHAGAWDDDDVVYLFLQKPLASSLTGAQNTRTTCPRSTKGSLYPT